MDLPRATVRKEDVEEVLQNITTRNKKVWIQMSTGFECLDKMLGGLHKGQMIVVGGHPSIGKTSFVVSIVEHICLKNSIPVAFFSMKLSRDQLLGRMLFSYSRIELNKARDGSLDVNELERLDQAGELFSEKPIYIDDTSRLTPIELRIRVENVNKEQEQAAQCIIVDCLHMMDTETPHDTQRQRIAEISKHLKTLACDLDVPVIVLCALQLKSILADKKRRKPTLSDLGEDIIIERYADVIMLLHRDNYYCLGDSTYEPNNDAGIVITRNQNGPTGVVMLQFLQEFARFENMRIDKE